MVVSTIVEQYRTEDVVEPYGAWKIEVENCVLFDSKCASPEFWDPEHAGSTITWNWNERIPIRRHSERLDDVGVAVEGSYAASGTAVPDSDLSVDTACSYEPRWAQPWQACYTFLMVTSAVNTRMLKIPNDELLIHASCCSPRVTWWKSNAFNGVRVSS